MMKRLSLAGLAALAVPVALAAVPLIPYQNTRSVNVASCGSTQCSMTFPAVPANKRLVVTSVSAQLGPVTGPVTIEGNGTSYFVPKADASSGYIAAPVTIYFSAGSTPTARLFVPAGTPNTSIIVTLVGNLIPD